MKRVFILISLLLLTLSCTKSGLIEPQIVERTKSCKPNTLCIIRMKELTDFEWDQMHVFSPGASQKFIEKSLGTPFPDYVEFKRRVVFVKAGKIVHRDDQPTDIEHPNDGQVSFAESYAEPSHWLFSPETAAFNAEKRQFGNGSIYVMTPVK